MNVPPVFSFSHQIKIVDDLQPVGAGKQELPYMKMEDTQYFAKLLEDVDEESLSADEQKERKIMRLLLKIKNGTPPMRKVRDREPPFPPKKRFNSLIVFSLMLIGGAPVY